MPDKLTFGVLCNSLMLEKWQVETIDHLRSHGVALKLFVIKDSGPESTQSPLRSKIRKLFSKHALFYFYDRYFFHPASKEIIDYNPQTEGIPKFFIKPYKKGYFSLFQEEDLQVIRTMQPDFLLRFGFGIIGGEILTIPRFGIWSFHHGDEQKYRGGPPGFWEILFGDPVTGVILQRLNERLDRGVILRKGWFKTQNHSYTEQLDQAYLQTTRWPLQVCLAIQHGTLAESLSDSQAPLYRLPDNKTFIKFIFKLVINRLLFNWNELTQAEDWNIGIIHSAIQDVVKNGWDPEQVSWFPKPERSKFVADPFLLETQETTEIVFEYYSYRKAQGEIYSIGVHELSGFPGKTRKRLINGCHTSFPFLFLFEGDQYLIPETYQENRIALYRMNRDSGYFEYLNTLVNDVRGVDASLVHHQDLWWLFFTKQDLPSVHLYLYYSPSLFELFKPHLNNPVKTDIRSSRPAGRFFYIDNLLIRPSQDCSGHYGKQVVLNKILHLSPIEFREEEVFTICPRGDYYHQGLHTVNGNDQITVIDGKRFRFLWTNFFQGIRRKAAK